MWANDIIIKCINDAIKCNDIAEQYKLVKEVKEKDDPTLYRKALTETNLSENLKEELVVLLRKNTGSLIGIAENFFYEYLNDSEYLSRIFPNGYIGIRLYIEEAFIKKQINVPGAVMNHLDGVILNIREQDISLTNTWLQQHVFREDKSNKSVPFDYQMHLTMKCINENKNQ